MKTVFCCLTLGSLTNSIAQEVHYSHRIEIGKSVGEDVVSSNSFFPQEMVTIKFLRFDTTPITSFSVFVADIDITNYVFENGIITVSNDYIEVSLPEFPAVAIKDATKTVDNLITLNINGETYSTIISIESDRQQRGGPAVAALATACGVGAASSAAVEIVDIFFDTKWYGVLPYPAYNGRDVSFSTISVEKERIVLSAVGGCVVGSGLKLIKGTAFANSFTQKAKSYLLLKIESAQATLSPLLNRLKLDIAALAKKAFSSQVKEVPGLIKTFATAVLTKLGLEFYVKEALLGAETPTPSLPKVSSVSPLTVKYGQKITFIINGINLPSTLAFWLDNCQGVTVLSGGTSTSRSFTCTPSFNKIGLQNGGVKDKAGGTILYSIQVNVKK